MATIINNPGTNSDDSGVGVVIGVVVGLLLIVLFFAYALPSIRGTATPSTTQAPGGATVNVQLPGGSTPAPASGNGTGY